MTEREAPAEPSWTALLGLGSNMGDKVGNIARAIALLTAPGDVRLVGASRLYRTAPWGVTDQDWFVNACIAVDTALSAHDLLARCLGVEQDMHRVREQRWGPRVIDVDVLVYRDVTLKNVTLNDADLVLPHPRIAERGFVLVPLAELAPELELSGHTLAYWMSRIDASDVVPLDAE
jgi:2-amino-4-hydroxy-6-hydroxymethyldihydropteridine diphosphokinase